jgi:hypothetical protein
MMELKDSLPLIVTLLLGVGGWIVAHWQSARRDIEEKKREIRVEHLRHAYLKLANVADRGNLASNLHDVQDAFNDIQLFGTLEDIAEIERFIDVLNEGKSPSINDLLRRLRNEIRRHIGLHGIDEFRLSIRVERAESTPTT